MVIAILDSGVDVGHPDLRQVSGYDFGDNDTNPNDNSAEPMLQQQLQNSILWPFSKRHHHLDIGQT